jgi:hypothetical protein
MVFGVFSRYWDLSWAGSDVLTSIETSRFLNWDDVLGPWYRPFMSRPGYDPPLGLFHRPVVGNFFAWEYALFGLNAVGYHVTNTLYHLWAVLAVYWLLRELGINRWAAFVGVLLVGFHPVMAASVPFVSRRHDPVALALMAMALAFVARGARQERFPNRSLIAGVFAMFWALLGKESAWAGLGLAPLVWGAVALSQGLRWQLLLLRGVAVAASFGVLGALVFWWRSWLFKGLGGYFGKDVSSFSLEESRDAAVGLGRFVFWTFRQHSPGSAEDWIRLGLLTAGVLALALFSWPHRHRPLLALGAVWVIGYLAGFGLLQFIGPWYGYHPLAGLAILCACALEAAVLSVIYLRQQPSAIKALRVAGSSLLAILVAVFYIGQASWAPGVRSYAVLHDVGRVMQGYFDGLAACVADVPPGATITFENVPEAVDFSEPETNLLYLTMYLDFTMTSTLRLLQGGEPRVVKRESTLVFRRAPVAIEPVECSGPPTARVVKTKQVGSGS